MRRRQHENFCAAICRVWCRRPGRAHQHAQVDSGFAFSCNLSINLKFTLIIVSGIWGLLQGKVWNLIGGLPDPHRYMAATKMRSNFQLFVYQLGSVDSRRHPQKRMQYPVKFLGLQWHKLPSSDDHESTLLTIFVIGEEGAHISPHFYFIKSKVCRRSNQVNCHKGSCYYTCSHKQMICVKLTLVLEHNNYTSLVASLSSGSQTLLHRYKLLSV